MPETFIATLIKDDKVNATGISIPPDVVAALGKGKKPAVKVTLNGFTYRSTVSASGDVFMLPVSAEHREAAGLKAGDQVQVTLELDLEPRTVEIPPDLATALEESGGARAAFDALAFSKRKEFVRQVQDAKTQETRQRRIAGIVAKMQDN